MQKYLVSRIVGGAVLLVLTAFWFWESRVTVINGYHPPEFYPWSMPAAFWLLFVGAIVFNMLVWYRWYTGPSHFQGGGCRQCGYDLTGNLSGRCPECGTPIHGRIG